MLDSAYTQISCGFSIKPNFLRTQFLTKPINNSKSNINEFHFLMNKIQFYGFINIIDAWKKIEQSKEQFLWDAIKKYFCLVVTISFHQRMILEFVLKLGTQRKEALPLSA